jgi:hypothetical protein
MHPRSFVLVGLVYIWPRGNGRAFHLEQERLIDVNA